MTRWPGRAASRQQPLGSRDRQLAGQPTAARRQPTAMMSGRYQRAFTIAVVFLVAGWHLAGAGGQLLRNRPAYASFAFQGAMWLVMALAIAAGSVLVLRGALGWRPAWAVAVIALAASTAAAAASPAGQMLAVNWAWGSAGLDGRARAAPPPVRRACLVPRRRGRWPSCACRLWDGLHRTDLAGFLAVLAWSTGAQVAVAAGVRALDVAADQAAAAARSEDAARERAATAEIISVARHARWLALQESAVPLVAELAAGTADPGDAQVRVRCAVQAARLRRLLAEGDEVPGPLVHELHASADVAERRGVAVEIETAGPLPPGARPGPAGDHRRRHRDPDRRAQQGADHPGGGGRRNRRQLRRRYRRGRPAARGRRRGRHRTAARRRHALGGGAMEQQVTVAIIEDHPVVTEGVASWIRSDPGQRVRLVQTARDLAGLRAGSPLAADVVILGPGAVRRAGHRADPRAGGGRVPGGGLLRAQRPGDRHGDAGQRRARVRVQGRGPRPPGRGRARGRLRPPVRDPVAGQGDARRPAPGPAGAVGAGAAGAAAVVPGHVEGIGRAAHVGHREHRPAVHQPRARQVRGHRAHRAEQGRAARPRDRGRRDQAGRDHAVPVIRPHHG